MNKKRSEGKPYRVYMMASANKFLRILLRFCESLLGFSAAQLIFVSYHLAGRRFDFEMLSGLILCCLFRCSQNLKFLLDFC